MKPNILFVNLPGMSPDKTPDSVAKESRPHMGVSMPIWVPLSMPLGILYLSSYIREHSDVRRVGILDYVLALSKMPDYPTIQEFIRQVALSQACFAPDILAFSFTLSTSQDFFTLCVDELKTIWPEAKTVVGGVHATNCTREILQNRNVDFVIRGEGEIAFSHFLNQFSTSGGIVVKGLYSKTTVEPTSSLELADSMTD
jgi:hypothetical protein